MNYIRSEVRKGNTNPDVSSKERFSDDTYLVPILEDDAVLYSLEDLDPAISETLNSKPAEDLIASSELSPEVASMIEQLQEQNRQLQKQNEHLLQSIEDAPYAKHDIRKQNLPAENYDREYFEGYANNGEYSFFWYDTVNARL